MISENSKKVIDFLKSVHGVREVINVDVMEATGLSQKAVDACFTQSVQRKGYGERVPGEIELPDGTHKAVKFMRLNDAGMAYDYNAVADEK